jgi:hypothetical protein
VIIAERSSPSRVRFAAPNNGAPLTDSGPFRNNTPEKRERLQLEGRGPVTAIAAKVVPFFAATDKLSPGHVLSGPP